MILYEWGLLVIRACHLPIHCECVLDLASSHCVFCHSRWKVSVLYVIHWSMNWCLVQDVLKHWDHFVHVYTLPLGNASKWEYTVKSVCIKIHLCITVPASVCVIPTPSLCSGMPTPFGYGDADRFPFG